MSRHRPAPIRELTNRILHRHVEAGTRMYPRTDGKYTPDPDDPKRERFPVDEAKETKYFAIATPRGGVVDLSVHPELFVNTIIVEAEVAT